MAAISKTPSGNYRGVFTSQPLDSVVDAVNNMQGNGTPSAGTFSSLTTSGPNTLGGNNKITGGTSVIIPSVIAAAGSTQLGATLIPSRKVVVTATASTEGVLLPVWATGLEVDVLNVGTTHKFKVWPNVNAKVSTGTSNSADATLLAAMKNTTYKAVLTNTWIAERSA